MITSQVNLKDADTLRSLIAWQRCDDLNRRIGYAADTVLQNYETLPQFVSNPKYARRFPLQAEVLNYIVQGVKEKQGNVQILEIAGAIGVNAVFLALCGAGKVFMNDIGKKEIATFEMVRKGLAPSIAEQMEAIEGSCFDILKLRPELKEKIDTIVCHNLIHFFKPAELEEFFNLVKQTLKPGGEIILTANGILDKEHRNLGVTSFVSSKCLLEDHTMSGAQPVAMFLCEYAPCSAEEVGPDYSQHRIYIKKLGEKWTVDNEAFKTLPKDLQLKLKDAITNNAKNKKKIKQITGAGSVRVLRTAYLRFTPESLSDLLKAHGFEVKQSYWLNTRGHIISDDSQGCLQVGIIAQYNPQKEESKE